MMVSPFMLYKLKLTNCIGASLGFLTDVAYFFLRKPGDEVPEKIGERPSFSFEDFEKSAAGVGIPVFCERIVNSKMHTENGGDAIHIEQLEVFARIGVPDDERADPQRLTVSMTFWPTKQGRELGDDLSRTVDYAAVCAETATFVSARSDRLIETLADALANRLLGVFEIRRITLELRKFILPDVQFVSVTVTRDRVTK
jgi:dihydroneopterin aldolase